MMKKDEKSHLWIPEQEVEHIQKIPRGRDNQYGLDSKEHGNKLSAGLKEIMDLFQRFKAGDSLCDEDMMVFKVALQEKEDFFVKRKFIEDEGMKINAVKDKTHAIVSVPLDVFGILQGRVKRYKDQGIKKDFQYISGFEPVRVLDKQSASLIKYYTENPDQLTVDIQIMLLPALDIEIQKRAAKKIEMKISERDGKIQDAPYQLTDGTTIIRAMISVDGLNDISNDQAIYRVEKTSFFHSLIPSLTSSSKKRLCLNPNIKIESLPTVVVLDDGVQMPDGLASIIPVHWRATGCRVGEMFGGHGTPVASRVAFESLGIHLADPYLTPRAKIIDAQIIDTDTTPANVMIQRIREAVQTFSSVAKVFNFSYNAMEPIEGDEISFLGCEMDLLSKAYNIKFVISAGNHKLVFIEDNLKNVIEDDDSRIAEPADSMLGITVGAVVGATHKGSVSRENEIAPYSRRGPGFCGFYKPDLVAYGATQFKDGQVPSDPYAICLSSTGICILPGTSFTAPTVAGDLVQVSVNVPDNDINLAQTLLYNGALPLYNRTAITQEEINLAGNLYGRGLSSPSNSSYSYEDKVSFLHKGTLNRLTKKRVKFYIPSTLAGIKVKRGEKKAKVTVTCIAQPPIDRTRGSEYSAAYISASIHRLNTNGIGVTDNPSVSDNRNKWDTCYHFTNEFSAFSAGDWEIWLELFTRWGVADDEEISYSLVITIEDLTQSGNMYSQIIRETAGRFRPVASTRVSVR
jgi:hypothetical protein